MKKTKWMRMLIMTSRCIAWNRLAHGLWSFKCERTNCLVIRKLVANANLVVVSAHGWVAKYPSCCCFVLSARG